jgi:hypothetical protein
MLLLARFSRIEKAIARNFVSVIARICDAIANNYESIAKNHENRQLTHSPQAIEHLAFRAH